MTRAALKQYFRQFFKVVAGGPVSGPNGLTRSAGILASLDKLVDEATLLGEGIGQAQFDQLEGRVDTAEVEIATLQSDLTATENQLIDLENEVAGMALTTDQRAALDAANGPSAANPFATLLDVGNAINYSGETYDPALTPTTNRLAPVSGGAYAFSHGGFVSLLAPTDSAGASFNLAAAIFAIRVPAGAPPLEVRSGYKLDGVTIATTGVTVQPGTSLLLGFDNSQVSGRLFTIARPATTSGGADIDYANPVSHASAVTLDSTAFGKQHVFTGTGAALWTVALPDPAGHAGQFIELVIDSAASGMWAFQAADISGQPERRLWSGEVDLLQVNPGGTGYIRKSGTTKPLCARIQGDGNGNVTFGTNAFFTAALPVVVYDQSPGNLMTATAHQLTVLRAGKYTLNGSLMGVYTTQNNELDLLCAFNGNYQNLGTLTDLGSVYQPSGTGYIRLKATGVVNLAVGNYYAIQVYSAVAGALDNRGANPSYIPGLELVEVPRLT